MTLATIVNRLKAEGTIEQVRVNRYRINDTYRSRGLGLNNRGEALYTLVQIHEMFAVQTAPNDWTFRRAVRLTASTVSTFNTESQRPVERRRTITRQGYHSNGSGVNRNGCQEALRRIPVSEDGVRRSFGLEWEINRLTEEQEDKLARLLDTLPAHHTERDGSLSSSGVEIVFLPLGEEKIIEVWNTLQTFCREEHIDMMGTGAHLTFGVSNSSVSRRDLQIRINRIALAVKAACEQGAINRVFGRDFTGYARLPQSTTTEDHSNAWSAMRDNTCYELRLCHWKGKIEKIVEFMKATEFVFHRTFNAQDFVNIFTIMGSSADGE